MEELGTMEKKKNKKIVTSFPSNARAVVSRRWRISLEITWNTSSPVEHTYFRRVNVYVDDRILFERAMDNNTQTRARLYIYRVVFTDSAERRVRISHRIAFVFVIHNNFGSARF